VQKIRQHPILILLIVNLLVGIFTFRNYGLSWDEPLFYDYANALRYAYSPQMDLACDYARAQFDSLGLTTWFDEFSYGGHALKNVVAVKEGALDPSVIYLIGGHLDSISSSPWTLAPGAEDNGSGAAAVVETARLLASLTCDYTIYFVCFSAEEQGLRGSEHFAVHRQGQAGHHFLPRFEHAIHPDFIGRLQFLFTTAHHAAVVEEVHGVDDLVLQKSADVHHVAHAAALDQQVADFQAGKGAVVAHITCQPHRFAEVETLFHGVFIPPSFRTTRCCCRSRSRPLQAPAPLQRSPCSA